MQSRFVGRFARLGRLSGLFVELDIAAVVADIALVGVVELVGPHKVVELHIRVVSSQRLVVDIPVEDTLVEELPDTLEEGTELVEVDTA